MLILKETLTKRIRPGKTALDHNKDVWFDKNVKCESMYLGGLSNFSLHRTFMVDSENSFSEVNYLTIHSGLRNKTYVLTIRSTGW